MLCPQCAAPILPREAIYNRALGEETGFRCLDCLARENGKPPAELETVLRHHVARRVCLSTELKKLEGAAVPQSSGMRPYSPDDLSRVERYSRQLLLSQVGDEGQSRLSRGRVLVAGTGGLGSPASMYLAAAGVGTLGLVDSDSVDLSNLQRQLLHGTSDLGRLKVDSAFERLGELNPTVNLVRHALRISNETIDELLRDYDLVVDGSDNLETRHVLNRACVRAGKPLIHGAILQFYGQATVIAPGGRPCYHCLFPEKPEATGPSCQMAGVMGAVAGVIGSIQALEAIKWLLEGKSSLVGELWTWDGWTMSVDRLRYGADPTCPVCVTAPSRTSPGRSEAWERGTSPRGC